MNTRTHARAALLLSVSLLIASPLQAQRARTAAPETLIAITGGTLRPGDGAAIENATIVIRGERIVSVGAGAAAPAGATLIDATGMIITPGLIAPMTAIGLAEIELEDSTMDTAPEGDDADAIRAAFTAADGYNPLSTLIPVARLGGVTTAISTPEGGLVPGTSSWVDLAGRDPSSSVREAQLALHISLTDSGISAGGGARGTAIGRLRALFDDARLYARSRAGYDRGQFRDTDVSRQDLDRVGLALAGRIPTVIRVSRAADILRVLELGREYGLRLVISDAEEGWMVADRIAAASVPVIVQALVNAPSTFSSLHSRYDNAALLSRAGVRVVLMSPGAWDVRNLRQEAGNAVRWGMDPDAALAAITSVPAQVFGMDADYGTVAPGKVASLVVWSGDPFELTTSPMHVLVRGRDMPLRSRQTLLFERYRDLSTVRRGFRSIEVPLPPPSDADDTAVDDTAVDDTAEDDTAEDDTAEDDERLE